MRYNSYYFESELQEMGFRSLGERVMISRDARIMSPETISVGDNVLIDAFTIINGDVTIGNHVHISSHCEIFGGKHSFITIGEYCGIASHTSVYGQTDDYVGPYLNNPTISLKYRALSEKPVELERCVLIATHCVVLPGVHLGEGCSFGANSLINRSTPPGGMYIGTPCRRVREKNLEEMRRKAQELEAKERCRKERRDRLTKEN